MTPDESRKAFAAAYHRQGLDLHTTWILWSLRVLDVWRAKDRDARSWMMHEAGDVRVDACLVMDLKASPQTSARSFPGTSADAARIAAAKTLATEDPELLFSV